MNAAIVMDAARQWLGTPYRHRASTLGAGCDCLGLLRGVWRTLYGEEPGEVPPYSADWRSGGQDGALQQAAERFLAREAGPIAAGQVVLFRLGGLEAARHCGIMVSPQRFIHAQEHLGVVEANFTDGWARRVTGRFRFPDLAPPAADDAEA